MKKIVFARTTEHSCFNHGAEPGFGRIIDNMDKFLFEDSVRINLMVLYNAIKALCDAETTGIVIYHNRDTREKALEIMRDAFEFISKASNITIRLIYQVEEGGIVVRIQTEDFLA